MLPPHQKALEVEVVVLVVLFPCPLFDLQVRGSTGSRSYHGNRGCVCNVPTPHRCGMSSVLENHQPEHYKGN